MSTLPPWDLNKQLTWVVVANLGTPRKAQARVVVVNMVRKTVPGQLLQHLRLLLLLVPLIMSTGKEAGNW